jgi:hypothetical protein
MKKIIGIILFMLLFSVSYSQQATSSNQVKQIGNQRTQILQNTHDSTLQVYNKIVLDSLKYKQNQVMGKNGSYIVTGTTGTTYSGVWCLTVLEAVVLDTLIINGTVMKTVTLAAGQNVYGDITRVKPTSGKFMLIK